MDAADRLPDDARSAFSPPLGTDAKEAVEEAPLRPSPARPFIPALFLLIALFAAAFVRFRALSETHFVYRDECRGYWGLRLATELGTLAERWTDREAWLQVWRMLIETGARPGNTLAAAFADILFQRGADSMKYLSATCSVLAVAVTWWIGRELFGVPVGLAAAVLLALAPHDLVYARCGLPCALESLLVALAFASYLRSHRATRSAVCWLLLSGSMAAAAFATHPSAGVAPLLLALLAAGRAFADPAATAMRRVLEVAVRLAGIALPLGVMLLCLELPARLIDPVFPSYLAALRGAAGAAVVPGNLGTARARAGRPGAAPSPASSDPAAEPGEGLNLLPEFVAATDGWLPVIVLAVGLVLLAGTWIKDPRALGPCLVLTWSLGFYFFYSVGPHFVPYARLFAPTFPALAIAQGVALDRIGRALFARRSYAPLATRTDSGSVWLGTSPLPALLRGRQWGALFQRSHYPKAGPLAVALAGAVLLAGAQSDRVAAVVASRDESRQAAQFIDEHELCGVIASRGYDPKLFRGVRRVTSWEEARRLYEAGEARYLLTTPLTATAFGFGSGFRVASQPIARFHNPYTLPARLYEGHSREDRGRILRNPQNRCIGLYDLRAVFAAESRPAGGPHEPDAPHEAGAHEVMRGASGSPLAN